MRRLVVLSAAAAVAGVLSLSTPAFAATGYPPPPTGQTITLAVGQCGTLTYTGFDPGAAINFAVNGAQASTGTAGTDGTVTANICVTDPHISVNSGTKIAVPYGSNTVSATGTGAGSSAITVDGTVIIPTPSTTTTVPAGGGGTTGSSGGGSLAFTGGNIALMVAGGLILIALGTGLVSMTRRRRTSHA